MGLAKFKQFESAHDKLYKDGLAPQEISEGLEQQIAQRLNEKELDQFGMLFELGLWDKLKNKIAGFIPGTTIKKADEILNRYKKEKLKTLQLNGQERLKAFNARTQSDAKPNDSLLKTKSDEIVSRTNKVISTIEKAEAARLAAIEKELGVLAKGTKKERVINYIELKLAQVKEEVAKQEIEDAKKYTSEDQLNQLEEIVSKRRKVSELSAKLLQLSAELSGAERGAKEGQAIKKEVENPEVGKKYKYTKNNGDVAEVEVVGDVQKNDQDEDIVPVKGERNQQFTVLKTRLFTEEDSDDAKIAASPEVKKIKEQIAELEKQINKQEGSVWGGQEQAEEGKEEGQE